MNEPSPHPSSDFSLISSNIFFFEFAARSEDIILIKCWNWGPCRGWSRGWSSEGCGPCALVHSQGLSLLPSSSIIQDILPYLSSGYEPGSQGIFIEEAFYCIVLLRSFTSRATSKFAARKSRNDKMQHNNEWSINHQPARNDLPSFPLLWRKCCWLRFIELATYSMRQRRSTSFSRSFFSRRIPTYIQALFTVA